MTARHARRTCPSPSLLLQSYSNSPSGQRWAILTVTNGENNNFSIIGPRSIELSGPPGDLDTHWRAPASSFHDLLPAWQSNSQLVLELGELHVLWSDLRGEIERVTLSQTGGQIVSFRCTALIPYSLFPLTG